MKTLIIPRGLIKKSAETDKLINEENGKALVLHDVISRLEHMLSKLSNEIGRKKAELQKICIHNETITKETYIQGGYLHREEYIITIVCKFCGKELDRQIKYGGFG